jgi:hypothetical protein
MSRRTVVAQNNKRTPLLPLVSLHDVLSIGMYNGQGAESKPVMQYKTLFYAASLKGFLEMENGTKSQNPEFWENLFSVATTWSPEGGRMNNWAWHVENGIGRGAADGFIQKVKATADEIRASKAADLNNKLSNHYRESIKQVVMHKVLFGGEYVDVDKPYGGNNVLKPLGIFFVGQVATFLGRKNGSVPALVRMVNDWKRMLPPEYARMIPSDFVEDVFREAVRLAYHPQWNSNMQNVELAAARIKASW